MAKPTTDPTWATDAAYDADAEPNKLEPPTILREEGWERGEEPGAQHVNHVLNSLGDHVSFLHRVFEDPDAEAYEGLDRGMVIPAAWMTPFRITGTPAMLGFSDPGVWEITDDDVGLWMPLNRVLPYGAAVAGVDLLMSASTKSAAGTFGIYFFSTNFGTPGWGTKSTLAEATTSGPGAQILAANATFGIGSAGVHYVRYVAGTISAGVDQLAALRLRFADPGPRNI